MSGPAYLGVPAVSIPLPDSPLPSRVPSPLPIAPDVDPSQPTYISDFTRMLGYMNQNQAQFQEQLTRVMATLVELQHPPAAAPEVRNSNNSVKLRNPCTFNGRHEEVVPCLSEVQRIIEFHPSSFPDDHRKVLFVAMYLKDGIPIEWFNHLESTGSSYLHNWPGFMSEFRRKFTDPRLSSTADQKLERLKQTGSAHAYLTRFVELSSHLEMTEQTKINRFMKGLKPAIKDNLVSIIDRPLTLMGWENIIIQVDANLHQRDLERKDESKTKTAHQKTSSAAKTTSSSVPVSNVISTTPDVIPMEVDAVRTGRGKLTAEEREH